MPPGLRGGSPEFDTRIVDAILETLPGSIESRSGKMKFYWMLFNKSTLRDPLVADQAELHGVDPDDLCKGRRIYDWNNASFVAVAEDGRDGEPDDVLQSVIPVPIFSRRLRDALTRLEPLEAQYLDLRVMRSNGESIDGFAVANILTRIAALDMDRSQYRVFPPDYFIVERRGLVNALRVPALRREALSTDVHVFRLIEFWPCVFVSERFVNVFRFSKFTGADFEEVEVS